MTETMDLMDGVKVRGCVRTIGELLEVPVCVEGEAKKGEHYVRQSDNYFYLCVRGVQQKIFDEIILEGNSIENFIDTLQAFCIGLRMGKHLEQMKHIKGVRAYDDYSGHDRYTVVFTKKIDNVYPTLSASGFSESKDGTLDNGRVVGIGKKNFLGERIELSELPEYLQYRLLEFYNEHCK